MNLPKINIKKYLSKKYWKIHAAILVGLVAVVTLILCLTLGGKNATPEETTPENTTPEVTTPEATTPEETTPEEPEVPVIPTKALTSVSITAGESSVEQLAADELKKHLSARGVEINENGLPITLTIDSSLGDDAYRIEGVANVTDEQNNEEYVNIIAGNGRGVFYGVVRFLEDFVGVRYFTYELETYLDVPVALPETISINYTPVFEYRYTSWYAMSKDPLFCLKSGMNGNHGGITEELGGHMSYAAGLGVHTLGVLCETTYPYPAYAPNPCLTDPEVFATVLKNVRAALEKDPTVNIISISQNDKEEYCHCERCAAIDEEEGSPAGTLLRFVNAIAEDLEADYPDLIIDTLAYKYTRKAPTKTVPRDNVCIRLCSIECHFNHPLTTESCKTCSAFREDIIAWNEICDNLYIWDYTTDFSYYISYFPNLHVLRKNMEFYADHHVKGMFEQGNGQGLSGEFGELRAYLLAKLMMNPYMTNEEYYNHMDEFLAGYYGAGWENIRAYINQLSALANIGTGHTIYHQPFTAISSTLYRSIERQINKWWDATEKAAGDRLEYVQRSRFHWRYMELMLHPDEEKAKQLIADVEGLGMAWREGKYHVNLQESDLKKGPGHWKYY
jgi:hypothetical protein